MTFKRQCQPITTRDGAKSLRNSQTWIDFSSNDYLGYSQDTVLLQQLKDTPFTQFGSTGSRLLGGDYDLTHTLEKSYATFRNKDAALFFNSGYQMNSGLFQALCQKDDLIIADKFAHASLIDGALKSSATLMRYKHNDVAHLEQLLSKHRNNAGNCWIVSETLFSMDGDLAPIKDLIKLKKKFNCHLILDDAHGFGALGKDGVGGISRDQARDIDLLLATFGKALGSSGAIVACTQEIKDQLIDQCRAFIFSTALPLPVIQFNQFALDKLPSDTQKRESLAQLATYFRDQAKALSLPILGTAHIISLIVGDEAQCKTLEDTLKKSQIWAQSIRTPTVPKGQARLRFSLTSAHTQDMIEHVIKALHDSR